MERGGDGGASRRRRRVAERETAARRGEGDGGASRRRRRRRVAETEREELEKEFSDKWRNMNISKSKRLLDTDTDVGVTAPKANPTSSSTDHPSMKEDLEKLCRNKDVALGKRPMQTSSRETLDSAAETTVAPCVAEAENKVLISELEFIEAENKVLIAELELLEAEEVSQIAEHTDAIKILLL